MMGSPSLLIAGSIGIVGLALSADSGFDWGDPDEDYDSPFADEAEEEEDDAPDEPTENPFASVADDADETEDESTEATSGSSTGEGVAPIDAEPLATETEARSLCDDVVSALHDEHTEQAFDRLGVHWAFAEDEMTQLQGEVERTRAVVADRYGDALDVRLVRADTVDDVLVRFVYLERFARHGLRWQFTFYRGEEGWTLNDVYFDDEIESLL